MYQWRIPPAITVRPFGIPQAHCPFHVGVLICLIWWFASSGISHVIHCVWCSCLDLVLIDNISLNLRHQSRCPTVCCCYCCCPIAIVLSPGIRLALDSFLSDSPSLVSFQLLCHSMVVAEQSRIVHCSVVVIIMFSLRFFDIFNVRIQTESDHQSIQTTNQIKVRLTSYL